MIKFKTFLLCFVFASQVLNSGSAFAAQGATSLSKSVLLSTLGYLLEEKAQAESHRDMYSKMASDQSREAHKARMIAYTLATLGLAVPAAVAGSFTGGVILMSQAARAMYMTGAEELIAGAFGWAAFGGVLVGAQYSWSHTDDHLILTIKEFNAGEAPVLNPWQAEQIDLNIRQAISKFSEMHQTTAKLCSSINEKINDSSFIRSLFGFKHVSELELMVAEAQAHLEIENKKLKFIQSSITILQQLAYLN